MINFKTCLLLLLFLVSSGLAVAQNPIRYSLSFERAEQQEALIEIEFSGIERDSFLLQMSRSSPGRYAVHEFAKNVFDLKAVDAAGKPLILKRLRTNQWQLQNPPSSFKVSYRLFGDRADGTYAQIDDSHAHLNIPASFIYAPELSERSIEVKILPRKDLNWRVATQLEKMGDFLYRAPNLYYLLDSPIMVSDHQKESFEVEQDGKTYTIEFVLQQDEKDPLFEKYVNNVKLIVEEQRRVFGEYPAFDFDRYTFLAAYTTGVDGDGMEHRNSTVLTSTRPLSKGGFKRNIGTVAHEFFHAWNVERLRPKSLEPFDFGDANMSDALWFSEGFTSYYTNLTLVRAGLMSQEEYAQNLSWRFDYVLNSPGNQFYGPVGMSQQAPFTDAGTSIDPNNEHNTFISYYTYGTILGLGLDLSLRSAPGNLSLDGYMKLLWEEMGRTEKPFTLEDLQRYLSQYAGEDFAAQYFDKYIYANGFPDFAALLKDFGLKLEQGHLSKPVFGYTLDQQKEGWLVTSYPKFGSNSEKSGLTKGDLLQSIDGQRLNKSNNMDGLLKDKKAGDQVEITYLRRGIKGQTKLTLDPDKSHQCMVDEAASKSAVENRNQWLNPND